MNILLIGAAGFIGTNLTIQLAKNLEDEILIVDRNKNYFKNIYNYNFKNVTGVELDLNESTNFDEILKGQDVVYHLVSTTVPSTSNKQISQELEANVIFSSNLLESCVKNKVKKVVFISSGGTVYGKDGVCPIKEDTMTNPITSYGVQKLTIEKLLYLYNYMYGLDYRIIRLANPYGPYQRPNGILGAVTTFTYKALKNEEITVYGDGEIIRDYIFIDDAIKAILKITSDKAKHKLYNLGCGYGTSLNELLNIISNSLNIKLNVVYKEGRNVDVPINYLDISRYEKDFGKLKAMSLSDGVKQTAKFIKEYEKI